MRRLLHKSFALMLFTVMISFTFNMGFPILSLLRKSDVNSKNDQTIFAVAMFLVLVLISLNAFEVVSFWISGKDQELYVKRLVGIRNATIRKSVFVDFNLVLIISSIIGIIVSCAVMKTLLFEFNFEINLPTVLIATDCSLALLNIYAFLILRKKEKRITRGEKRW